MLLIKEREKLSFEEVAECFGIGKASVFRWSKRIEVQHTRHKPGTKINGESLKKDVAMRCTELVEMYLDA